MIPRTFRLGVSGSSFAGVFEFEEGVVGLLTVRLRNKSAGGMPRTELGDDGWDGCRELEGVCGGVLYEFSNDFFARVGEAGDAFRRR